MTDPFSATTTSCFYDSQGELIKTNTFPDGGTRIETYYMDGQLQRISGTAVHPVRYEYGAVSETGTNRLFSREIKLNNDGSDSSEIVTNYIDMVSRVYKMAYPDGAFSVKSFNSSGQLIRERDPDAVTTLYGYNTKGELETTAISATQGTSIDFNNDRASKTIADATTISGTDVTRRRTYLWMTNGASGSNLVSETRVSTDGLIAWDIRFGLTNQTSTLFPGSGYRVVTSTAPDGSSSISTNLNGQLRSVTAKDSGGSQIAKTTYVYDTHGRQALATDARTGTRRQRGQTYPLNIG